MSDEAPIAVTFRLGPAILQPMGLRKEPAALNYGSVSAPQLTPEAIAAARIEGKFKTQVLMRQMDARVRAIENELMRSNTNEALYEDNPNFGVF